MIVVLLGVSWILASVGGACAFGRMSAARPNTVAAPRRLPATGVGPTGRAPRSDGTNASGLQPHWPDQAAA